MPRSIFSAPYYKFFIILFTNVAGRKALLWEYQGNLYSFGNISYNSVVGISQKGEKEREREKKVEECNRREWNMLRRWNSYRELQIKFSSSWYKNNKTPQVHEKLRNFPQHTKITRWFDMWEKCENSHLHVRHKNNLVLVVNQWYKFAFELDPARNIASLKLDW